MAAVGQPCSDVAASTVYLTGHLEWLPVVKQVEGSGMICSEGNICHSPNGLK